MKYWTIYFILFSSVLLSCDGPNKPITSPSASEGKTAKSPKTCTAEAQGYTDWLLSFFSPTGEAQAGLWERDLLWYDGEDLPADIPVIAMSKSRLSLYVNSEKKYASARRRTSLSGREKTDINELIVQLQKVSSSPKPAVALAVSDNTPMDGLLYTLQRVKDKYKVGLVFLASSVKAPALFPKEALPEDQNAMLKQLENVWSACPQGFDLQGKLMLLSSITGEVEQEVLNKTLAALRSALQQCACQVDLSVAKAQNYSFLQRRKGTKKVVWVSLLTGQQPTLSGDQTWFENGTKLLQEFGKGNTRIVLESSPPPPPPPPSKKK